VSAFIEQCVLDVFVYLTFTIATFICLGSNCLPVLVQYSHLAEILSSLAAIRFF